MNETIRSFVAIELPVDIKNKIESYIDELRCLAPKLKWIRKEALHITLKFLGGGVLSGMRRQMGAIFDGLDALRYNPLTCL